MQRIEREALARVLLEELEPTNTLDQLLLEYLPPLDDLENELYLIKEERHHALNVERARRAVTYHKLIRWQAHI